MKPVSNDQYIEYMEKALPQLISSIMRDDSTAVSKGHISIPQFWALHHLNENTELTVNGLSALLNRSKSSTSALVQRLEASGLIKRNRSKTDQRVVLLRLTPKGKKIIVEIGDSRKKGISKTYASLNAEERSQHMHLIKKILSNVYTGLILTALLVPLSGHAQTNAYSLSDSITIGLKRSINVANAAREKEIARQKQRAALSGALPRLGALADYTLYDAENFNDSGTSTMGLEASWQVFAGGKTMSAIRAARAYKQLTAYQEQRIRETQARDIALAYYRIQLAKAQVETLNQSVAQLADFEADTRKKYDAGAASEFNWLSAKVSLANERPRLIAAENDLRLSKEGFKNLTYIDDSVFELSEPLDYTPIEINLDQAIALGLQKRPELLEKNSAVALRKEDVKQQKSTYFPTIDLFANYSYSDPDPFAGFSNPGAEPSAADHWSAGARAKWNLFDGFLREANVSETKLNMAIEEDEYRDLVRYVSLDIRTQWLRGRDAAEVIHATAENVQLAKRALEISRSRFDAGLSTNLEVTQANVELSDARLARAIALHEYMAAVTGIKYAMGIFLEEYE